MGPFKLQTDHDHIVHIEDQCSYCGSISPLKVIELLKTPGTKFEGTDQKYGYPHKFYLNSYKFYTCHLSQLSDEELKEFSKLSEAAFGIEFVRDDKGIMFRQPQTNSFYGWQLWGVIGPDGKPDHSSMK